MRLRAKVGRMAVIVAAVLLAAPMSMAQQGPGGGGGDGGGEPTDGSGSEYSDLVVALRDIDGLPVLAEYETLEGTEYCVQPVATEPLPGLDPTGIINPVDGTTVFPIPLLGDSPDLTEDDEVCDPEPAYAMYVSEAELERLNMARTDDDVLDQKLVDVMQRLLGTDQPVTLDSAGRLVIDGVVTDAGPEHAALFQALMLTGTIPGLDSTYVQDGMARIEPFGPWELAAVSLGSASSKFVPVTIDAAIYYNRITDVAEPTVPWRAPALSLLGRDPTYTGVDEEFVDYGDFSYTRADVFPGCATWLDVPTLTWNTGSIVDLAAFAPPPRNSVDGTLANVAGFAQLAADVRSAIFYLHEHEVIAGFYMDPVGQNTCDAQLAALTAPAIDFGPLPQEVVQTETFAMDASLYNPLDGYPLSGARIKVTVDAVDGAFTEGSLVTATTVDEGSITFEVDGNGDLVGWWGPPEGFPVSVRYLDTSSFQVRVDEDAPTGMYNLTLELISPTLDGLAIPVPTDTATINVLDDVVTARWIEFPGYVDQDVNVTATARVFNPETALPTPVGTELLLTVVGPEVTDPAEALVAEDLQIYVDAVRIPMALEDGSIVGHLALPELLAGAATAVTYYVMVADGAPIGMYEMTVEVVPADGDTRLVGEPDAEDMYVGPAEAHGEAPDDPGNGDGEETTTTTTTLPTTGALTMSLTDGHDATPETTFTFGTDGDTILVGDWDRDGDDTIGSWNARVWSLRNSNSTGTADLVFSYGVATDLPITGDWDGNGSDTVGVVRQSGTGLLWLLRDTTSGGTATTSFFYGRVGDIPIVGDWNRDGIDTPGVVRVADGKQPVFYLRNSLTSGIGEITVVYGAVGDVPLPAGDWNGDGVDTIGVRRGNQFLLRDLLSNGPATISFSFGAADDPAIVGDWNGDGKDTVGTVSIG